MLLPGRRVPLFQTAPKKGREHPKGTVCEALSRDGEPGEAPEPPLESAAVPPLTPAAGFWHHPTAKVVTEVRPELCWLVLWMC